MKNLDTFDQNCARNPPVLPAIFCSPFEGARRVSKYFSFARSCRRCRQFAPCEFEMWPSTLFHNVFYFKKKNLVVEQGVNIQFFSLTLHARTFPFKFWIIYFSCSYKKSRDDDMALTAAGMHFLRFGGFPWRGRAAFQQPNSTTSLLCSRKSEKVFFAAALSTLPMASEKKNIEINKRARDINNFSITPQTYYVCGLILIHSEIFLNAHERDLLPRKCCSCA